MADTKGSALPALAAADLADGIYIIDDLAGTPAGKLITVGNLLNLPFGQLFTASGVGTQTPGVTYVLLSQWDTNGASLGGVTPAAASDKITVTNTGFYFVALQLSFTGSDASVVDAAVFWNGVEQTQISFTRKLGTGADTVSGSALGIVDVTAGATDIDVRIKTNGAADVFDLKKGQLLVVRIGST